jgi:Zn-dependent peptidase ImmA (M78 family)
MKFRVNPYLKRIALSVGEQDVDRGVQKFVQQKLSVSESLEGLARLLGVNEILEEKMTFEGGLFKLPDGKLIIKLNAKSPQSRKRFTLAHEIGHLLLGTIPGRRSTQGSEHGSDASLERACDSIAAELLMPSEEAMLFIRGLGQPSPEKLREIASRYRTSLHAAAIRVHYDFRLWNCCIGMWERLPKIRTIWFVGRSRWDRTEPDSYSLDLALSSRVSVCSDELWPQGPSTDPVWLNLLRNRDNEVFGLVGFAGVAARPAGRQK